MRSVSCTQRKRCLPVLLALALLAGPAAAQEAAEPGANESGCIALCSSPSASNFDVAFDLIVLRPAGAAQALLGFVAFAGTAPLTAPGGFFYESWEVLVQTPFDDAFNRKLGEF